MKSISWIECFFIFETNDFRGVGLFRGVNFISFGILFQILGPVQRMDCAHLAVDEAAWTIVVPLLVDVLEVLVWRWKIVEKGAGIVFRECFCINLETSKW